MFGILCTPLNKADFEWENSFVLVTIQQICIFGLKFWEDSEIYFITVLLTV